MTEPIRPADDHDIAPWPTQKYDPHLPCPKCAAMEPGLEYRTLIHAAPIGTTGIEFGVREKLVITCWHCKYVWERLPLDTASDDVEMPEETKGRCGVCGAQTTFTHHGVNAYACDTCHAHSLSHSGAEDDMLVFRSIGDRLDRDIKVGGTD